MKKLLAIAVLLSLCIMMIPSAVFAADPTSFVVNWAGSGAVDGSATVKNDAVYSFATNGGVVSGNFNANGLNDNPYSYNVDSSNSYINADVTGGYMWFKAQRTDAYVPMYGSAGQVAASFVGSSGTGEMATGSGNNYASMVNATYAKPHTSGGYNYEASGSSYLITSYIAASGDVTPSAAGLAMAPVSNYAYFVNAGNGTGKINDMTNAAGSGVNLGWGGGCYTNANAALTGVGTFTVAGVGSNAINTEITGASGAFTGWNLAGNGTMGSVDFTSTGNYSGNSSIPNYSVTVK
ncbi:MAG: hypothetical protein EHM12_02070 [Dehalococcoidia bacterium]|nr:MAG: hypothetical protein EHM12_02070 [Dehalococcoidia bacterium]